MVLFSTPAELGNMREKMQKLQQQLEVFQKCTSVSQPKHREDNTSSQKQTSTESSPAIQQKITTLTSPKQSSSQIKPNQSSKKPQRTATVLSLANISEAELPGKVQSKPRTAHHPKTGRQLSCMNKMKNLPCRVFILFHYFLLVSEIPKN